MAADDSGNVRPFAGVQARAGRVEAEPLDPSSRAFQQVIEAIAAVQGAIVATNGLIDLLVAERGRHRAELDELHEAVAALSNRIESTNRVLASRTDHLA